MIRTLVFIFIIFLLLESCTITEEIHFNGNFSGKYKLEYDFSKLIDIIIENEAPDSLLIKQSDYKDYLDSIELNLQNINGISQIELINNAEFGILLISFHFEDIKSLNKSLKNVSLFNSDNVQFNPPYFKQERRKLYFSRSQVFLSDFDTDNFMNNMITKKIKINFDKKPQKVIIPDKDVRVRKGGTEIIQEGNLKTLSNKKSLWEFRFYRFFNVFSL